MKFMHQNPIIEVITTTILAFIGWIIHQIQIPNIGTTMFWAHEILQDGAWSAAIIIGAKSVIDFFKRKKK